MPRRAHTAMVIVATMFVLSGLQAQHHVGQGTTFVAAGGATPAPGDGSQVAPQLSPEQKMQRRFPQPARVGDLIGLPLLDWGDRTIGRIRFIVRTKSGKLQLVVTNGGFLGWGQRLVAVPIEVVAIAGRQLSALDMNWAEIDAAPTWKSDQTVLVGSDDIIQVALYKR